MRSVPNSKRWVNTHWFYHFAFEKPWRKKIKKWNFSNIFEFLSLYCPSYIDLSLHVNLAPLCSVFSHIFHVDDDSLTRFYWLTFPSHPASYLNWTTSLDWKLRPIFSFSSSIFLLQEWNLGKNQKWAWGNKSSIVYTFLSSSLAATDR